MKATRILSAAFIAAALVGCSQEEQFDVFQGSQTQFSGSFEQVASRVVLNDDYSMSWEGNEKVSIFPGMTVNNQYQVSSVTDGRASFSFVDYVTPENGYAPTNANYALYPYHAANSIAENGTMTASVPAGFTYDNMANSIKTALMAAKSPVGNLNFKNVQGILRLKLNAVQPFLYGAVESIQLESASQNLSGKVNITFDGEYPVATWVEGGKVLTLDLSAENKKDLASLGSYSEFYLPMVPAQFAANDVTLTINWANGTKYEVVVPINFNIERRKIYTLNHTLGAENFEGELEGAINTMWDGETITTPEIATDENGQEYYSVKHASDFAGIAAMVNGPESRTASAGLNIKLENDIDLNGYNWTPIGNWDNVFQGTFDGQGYTISNLKINAPTADGIGLFGVAENATIKNISVKNADITGKEMAAAVVGYIGTNSIVSNCHVTGNVNVVAETHVAGITAYSLCAIENSSVIADGTGVINSKIKNVAGGICGWLKDGNSVTGCTVKNLDIIGFANVGSIVGYVSYDNEITDCKAENIILTKTRTDGAPSIGALSGGWGYSNTKTILVKDVELKNITMNGTCVAYAFEDKDLFGSEYYGRTTGIFVKENITVENLTNNLTEIVLAKTLAELNALLADENVTEITLGANILSDNAVVMKSNKTINGNGYQLGCVNLNGADNVTLKGITFDAANAKYGYDGKGTKKDFAFSNIITGNDVNKPNKGAHNLVIDGCTFTGAFANPGAAIAFTDQNRGSGASGNITIKNCVFDNTNANYVIYAHYTGDGINGHGNFVIENNKFYTSCYAGPIYLGRYASSTPVVLKDNTFTTVSSLGAAIFVQDHSNYGVSINASNNTFAN